MTNIKYKAIKTKYWRPGTDYVNRIVQSIAEIVHDGDIIVVSEKSIAIAKGNIVNEEMANPNIVAVFLTRFWMRILWGYFLGYLCRFRKQTLDRLRKYPLIEGSRHKQIALNYAGFLQALSYGSEGGIDLSNLPYSYACLPLKYPAQEAYHIVKQIGKKTGKKATVIISDTDSTFTLKNLHFSSRPHVIDGIISMKSPIAFILGRFFKLNQRATPLAVAGLNISLDEALRYSEVAHHSRGDGAGRTIWDSAKKFRVALSEISWEMLEQIDHHPIVIIRIKH